MLQQLHESAVRYHRSGRLEEAESLYRQVLAHQADHAGALQMLGILAHQQNRHEEALDLVRRAITAAPAEPRGHSNLGIILAGMGRLDEAIDSFRHALSLSPDFQEARRNLVHALREAGRLDEAVAVLRQFAAQHPHSADAHFDLAAACYATGRLEESIGAYRRVLNLRPGDADAHNNLAIALKDNGDVENAIAAYRQAIRLRPGFAEACNNLGVALNDSGRLDEAGAALEQAISLWPGYAEAQTNLGNVYKARGDLDAAIACYRQALSINGDPRAADNLLYTLHYHPDSTPQSLFEEHARWNQVYAKPLASKLRPHANDRSPDRRLRIGYVSPDLGQHAIGRFMVAILANHDRERFQVFCYTDLRRRPDAVTRQLQARTEVWRETTGLSDDQLAGLIRHDGIDILVDLAMHTARNRLLVFARKPAPVQVTYLAYPSTTGLETMDYRLTDPYLDPVGQDERFYSEKSVRLPDNYWCYPPHEPVPEVAPPPALKNGRITFGCFNNFFKVTRPTLDLWRRLLMRVPDSRLVLYCDEGSHRQIVRDYLAWEDLDAACEEFDPTRLEFVARAILAEYFDRYQTIDIALDPFPYGGGTTTCDALWMGVPVVSLAGPTAVSRAGLSILSNAGLSELAAQTPEQYVHIAADLAADLPRLAALRSTIRSGMRESPLMDAPRFVRNLENAYRQMWIAWCSAPAGNSL